MILHGYFRSTASWRVRIALALKGLTVTHSSHHLRKGEQRAANYLAVNPQALVPALELDDEVVLTQSLAIIEFLDELHPDPPLLPADPVDRAIARSIALAIACDIHPIQNLKILDRVRQIGGQEAADDWARTTIMDGLAATEQLIQRRGGRFCVGDQPTLADICLVPQLGNARRFGVELVWPRIAAVDEACAAMPEFAGAVPNRQADAY
ncbi:maleylacetoacetate isomerase [Sphingomonas sp. AP4-R1]|uniref:maleylacetoacetate isomerase n=1 Tax=Sphingomonas sp. AP4-R1 TaxID=2735134 RepID=UPI001493BD7E|nr:maleylacetoacetate isomerase [Sphingomonas sp. AP4-R1]QJU58188.1 maleylacetoacetate isomerase [Sphingomonas sp. AP4-R1]